MSRTQIWWILMAIVLNPQNLLGFRIAGAVPGAKVGGKGGDRPPIENTVKIGVKPGVKT